MQHPDEGVIHTWLDGELPVEEAVALESHIADCADCAAAVAEARGLIAASSRIVSALDIVPGDVLPAAIPGKRAWYSSTQLRAAAAVIVVAGASLIVVKGGTETDLKQAMHRTESMPATVAPPMSRAERPSQAAPAATVESLSAQQKVAFRGLARLSAPTPARDAAKQRDAASNEVDKSLKARVADNAARPAPALEDKALVGKVSGAQVSAAAPFAVPARQAESRAALQEVNPQTPEKKLIDEPASVSVLSSSADEAPLAQVESDTTGTTVTTVYEVSPGVRVTLVEYNTAVASGPTSSGTARRNKRARSDTAARGNASAAPQPALRIVPVESISWEHLSARRAYSLVGPFSKEQLTALRERLPPSKR